MQRLPPLAVTATLTSTEAGTRRLDLVGATVKVAIDTRRRGASPARSDVR